MPPAMIPTLSFVLSLNARRVTCHQPRAGIWVGTSASSPGRVPFPVWVAEESDVASGPPIGPLLAAAPLVDATGLARYGSVRARRSLACWPRLPSAASPTSAQASAFAPGTPPERFADGSSEPAEDGVGDGGDVGGRDTGSSGGQDVDSWSGHPASR